MPVDSHHRVSLSGMRHDEGGNLSAERAVSEILGAESGGGTLDALGVLAFPGTLYQGQEMQRTFLGALRDCRVYGDCLCGAHEDVFSE